MNFCRLIKRNFKFLNEKGYKCKAHSYLEEYVVCYTSQSTTIEVYCALCVPSGKPTDFDKPFDAIYYNAWVVIEYGSARCNLLDCNLFDNDLLKELKLKIEAENEISLEETVNLYAQFIKSNIDTIKF